MIVTTFAAACVVNGETMTGVLQQATRLTAVIIILVVVRFLCRKFN